MAHGLNLPTLQTLIVSLAPPDYRAAIISANGLVLRLGQSLGPLIMGMVYAKWGMTAPFIAGAGMALSMAVLFVFFGKGDRGDDTLINTEI